MNSENDPIIDQLRSEAQNTRPAFSMDLHREILRKLDAERNGAQPSTPTVSRWSILRLAPRLAIAAAILVAGATYFIVVNRPHSTPTAIKSNSNLPPSIDTTLATAHQPAPPAPATSRLAYRVDFDQAASIKLFPLTVELHLPIARQHRQKRTDQRPQNIGQQLAVAMNQPAHEIDNVLVDLLPKQLRHRL